MPERRPKGLRCGGREREMGMSSTAAQARAERNRLNDAGRPAQPCHGWVRWRMTMLSRIDRGACRSSVKWTLVSVSLESPLSARKTEVAVSC